MICVKVRTGDDCVVQSSFRSHVLALLWPGAAATRVGGVYERGGQRQRAPAMVPVLSQRLRFCSVGPTDSYVRALEGWADGFGFGLFPRLTRRLGAGRRGGRRGGRQDPPRWLPRSSSRACVVVAVGRPLPLARRPHDVDRADEFGRRGALEGAEMSPSMCWAGSGARCKWPRPR